MDIMVTCHECGQNHIISTKILDSFGSTCDVCLHKHHCRFMATTGKRLKEVCYVKDCNCGRTEKDLEGANNG